MLANVADGTFRKKSSHGVTAEPHESFTKETFTVSLTEKKTEYSHVGYREEKMEQSKKTILKMTVQ